MKKGQIRTGIVEEVKFPNRAMVRLEPSGEAEKKARRDRRNTAR